MSARYAGQSTTVPSNAAGAGGIEGGQVGELMPGVLESLQEAPSAVSTSNLYYEEALGSFLAPSFQRQCGIKNETVQNIDGWSQMGTFDIPNDIFWDGPAALQIEIPIEQRWAGFLADGTVAKSSFMKPTAFYSWGAGYAAFRQFKTNLGGAGQYILDRYANFIGVFSSCFSLMQRYSLMKMAGGGVIGNSSPLDAAYGLHYETCTYGSVASKGAGGEKSSGVRPEFERLPVKDHWVVAMKTPHTNYQNPRIRRRPLDTKLFSEHFTVDFWLSSFDEFADTGAGISPISLYADPGLVTLENSPFIYVSNSNGFPAPETHRQYKNIYAREGVKEDGTDFDVSSAVFVQANSASYARYTRFFDLAGAYNIAPLITPADVKGLMGTEDVPVPKPTITTLINSMRLTNDMLGAYDVLKTRTDQAVYYPFQHFTTQVYYTQNTLYGGNTLNDYIQAKGIGFPADEKTSLLPIRQSIAIPVNPMTAMYVAVAREKDRRSSGISVDGAYSPALFWNLLELPYLQLSYGAEPLIRYSTAVEHISSQTYNHCSPVQIPYMGGACFRSELAEGRGNSYGVSAVGSDISLNVLKDATANDPPALADFEQAVLVPPLIANSPIDYPGKYTGVLRNAWIYELSLVEMEPLRNETFFQQTPSFQGEQLDLAFLINPSTLSSTTPSYRPSTDLSLLSSYANASATDTKGCVENSGVISRGCDATGVFLNSGGTIPGYEATEKGGASSSATKKVDVWHMNNDENLMVIVVYAQNALWQLNPNMSKLVFARG